MQGWGAESEMGVKMGMRGRMGPGGGKMGGWRGMRGGVVWGPRGGKMGGTMAMGRGKMGGKRRMRVGMDPRRGEMELPATMAGYNYGFPGVYQPSLSSPNEYVFKLWGR